MKKYSKPVDVELLKKYYTYRPYSGDFVSKHTGKVMYVYRKQKAGSTHITPLITLSLNGKRHRIAAHRVAWAMHYGFWPEMDIDHINGDTADNSIGNLRVVHSNRVNGRNMAKSVSNTSGVVGVTIVDTQKKGPRYIARIVNNDGVREHLGTFFTKAEAKAVYKFAAKKYGYHENHGRDPL